MFTDMVGYSKKVHTDEVTEMPQTYFRDRRISLWGAVRPLDNR
jgi:hypothetical protein